MCQGKEPPHLLSLFHSKPLIVYRSGTSRLGIHPPPPPSRLFQVRRNLGPITRIAEVGTATAEPKVSQVPVRWSGSLTCRPLQVLVSAASLNANDAFLLKSGDDSAYLWMGKGASEEERKGAEYMSAVLQCTSRVIEEGREPGLSFSAVSPPWRFYFLCHWNEHTHTESARTGHAELAHTGTGGRRHNQ